MIVTAAVSIAPASAVPDREAQVERALTRHGITVCHYDEQPPYNEEGSLNLYVAEKAPTCLPEPGGISRQFTHTSLVISQYTSKKNFEEAVKTREKIAHARGSNDSDFGLWAWKRTLLSFDFSGGDTTATPIMERRVRRVMRDLGAEKLYLDTYSLDRGR